MTDTNPVTSNNLGGLLTFAFAYEDYIRTGDLGVGIARLFAPILSERAGKLFDSSEIAEAITERFDLEITPMVVEGLIPRLKAAGQIREAVSSDQGVAFICKQRAVDDDEELNSKYQDFLETFAELAEDRLANLGFDVPRDDLKRHLLRFLANPTLFGNDSEAEYEYKGDTLTLEADEVPPAKPDAAIRFLCAEFTSKYLTGNEQQAELIEHIANGAMLCEVVLTLQSSVESREFENLTVILDGPLLLDMIGLGDDQAVEYASNLKSYLEQAGIGLFTFSHCVEEVQSIIHAAILGINSGEPPLGSVGRHLAQNTSNIADAQFLEHNLSLKLHEAGIAIMNSEELNGENYERFFDSSDIDYLRNHLGKIHTRMERRQRDADSIAFTLRLRGTNRTPEQLSESGFVFLLKNPRLNEVSTRYLRSKDQLSISAIPPTITDREMCGVLWLQDSGGGRTLSRENLVANCLQVIEPNRSLLNRVRQLIHDSAPEKLEEFSALARDRRARFCLSGMTLGAPAFANASNLDEILRQMYFSAADDVRKIEQEKRMEMASRHATTMSEKELDIVRQSQKHKKEIDLVSKQSNEMRDQLNQITRKNERTIRRLGKLARIGAHAIVILLAVLFVWILNMLLPDLDGKLPSWISTYFVKDIVLLLIGYSLTQAFVFESLRNWLLNQLTREFEQEVE